MPTNNDFISHFCIFESCLSNGVIKISIEKNGLPNVFKMPLDYLFNILSDHNKPGGIIHDYNLKAFKENCQQYGYGYLNHDKDGNFIGVGYAPPLHISSNEP